MNNIVQHFIEPCTDNENFVERKVCLFVKNGAYPIPVYLPMFSLLHKQSKLPEMQICMYTGTNFYVYSLSKIYL